MKVLTAGRDWQLQATDIGRFESLPFDALFDDDFWMFFRSRDDLVRFRARYQIRWAQQRVNGEWQIREVRR